MTVVGVTNDIRLPGRIGDANQLRIYAQASGPQEGLGFQLRAPNTVQAEILLRHSLRELAPSLKLDRIDLADSIVRNSLAPQRFAIAVMGAFAIISLCLTTIGLYGVVAQSVHTSLAEFGVRAALGASPNSLGRLVLKDALQLVAGGLLLGMAAAAIAGRALRSLLFGLNPFDPGVYLLIGILLTLTCVLASYVPTRRARRADPIQALRAE